MAFRRLLGEGNLFAAWADQCVAWKLETPTPFTWIAMAVGLGHLVGYKAWIQTANPHRFYPPISGLLLSPSGVCRRGVGSGIVMDIVKKAGGLVMDGTVTPEGIIDMLKYSERVNTGTEGGSRLLLYVEEMADTFSRKKSQEHLIQKLTALLNRTKDYDDITRSGMRGPNGEVKEPLRIHRPCLTTLLTSAPDWFLEAMPNEAKSGGFQSRIVGCYLDKREITHTDLTPMTANLDVITMDWATKLEEHAASANGVFYVSPDANRYYQRWYQACEIETGEMDEGYVRTIRVRRPENTLKIAMLLALAQNDASKRMVLTKELLDQAIGIVDYLEPTMAGFYGWTDDQTTVRGQLERAILRATRGGISHSDLSRRVSAYTRKGNGVQTLRSVLQGLVEQGKVSYVPRRGLTGTTLDPFTHDTAWPPQQWRWRGDGEVEGVDAAEGSDVTKAQVAQADSGGQTVGLA